MRPMQCAHAPMRLCTHAAGQANRVKNIFRGMALMFLPLGSYVPAGVALLWASNSMFSVVLGAALRQDSIRKMVRVGGCRRMQAEGEGSEACDVQLFGTRLARTRDGARRLQMPWNCIVTCVVYV